MKEKIRNKIQEFFAGKYNEFRARLEKIGADLILNMRLVQIEKKNDFPDGCIYWTVLTEAGSTMYENSGDAINTTADLEKFIEAGELLKQGINETFEG